MAKILEKALHTGVKPEMPRIQSRGIILSNAVALIAAFLSTVYLVYSLRNGWSFADRVTTFVILSLCCILLLNKFGHINTSRSLLSIIIPAAAITIMMLPRIQNPEKFIYLRTPGIFPLLLATGIIPSLIFSRKERNLLLICQSTHLLMFAGYDVVLRWFSTQAALPTLTQYLESNLVTMLSYFLLIGCILSLKNIIDDFDQKNSELISHLGRQNVELETSNRVLSDLNKDIEAQNEEIQAQSEELRQSQDSLVAANAEIERQKIALEKSLDEKSRDLLMTNQQLVSQNNELQQFSYTVSHNLRGPVASILGLINLHRLSLSEEEKEQTVRLLETSALSLESIIYDLSRIIDIRHDKFSLYESVVLEQELLLIKQSLMTFIDKNKVTIEEKFAHAELFSVKAYINSILYNLVSNAIQYRSPDREPLIQITSTLTDGHVVLKVKDNGLGIDLTRFRGDLFKLYKRFHTSAPGGKGLGLYLVKQQVEKMNGRIEVESTLHAGTTFSIFIPVKD
ncbi:MAG: hypothetical protein DI538_08330 [Azospira oryzae]|jgi:signal transduction histidine kinase|nr:MAG: hypothetical protein DI538_08330 [Azospira oryzae]